METQVNKVGLFVTAFIAILIGIVLVDVVADQVWQTTDGIYTASNEEILLSNGTAVNLANDWVTAVTTVAADNGTHNDTLGQGENYSVDRLNSDDLARVTLNDSYYDQNVSWVNYTYQDNNYIRGSAVSRTLVGLVVIFFVLAILATGIWAMYKMGLMDMIK